jgi:hypothetical protein
MKCCQQWLQRTVPVLLKAKTAQTSTRPQAAKESWNAALDTLAKFSMSFLDSVHIAALNAVAVQWRNVVKANFLALNVVVNFQTIFTPGTLEANEYPILRSSFNLPVASLEDIFRER